MSYITLTVVSRSAVAPVLTRFAPPKGALCVKTRGVSGTGRGLPGHSSSQVSADTAQAILRLAEETAALCR
jgi:hypothetical protein